MVGWDRLDDAVGDRERRDIAISPGADRSGDTPLDRECADLTLDPEAARDQLSAVGGHGEDRGRRGSGRRNGRGRGRAGIERAAGEGHAIEIARQDEIGAAQEQSVEHQAVPGRPELASESPMGPPAVSGCQTDDRPLFVRGADGEAPLTATSSMAVYVSESLMVSVPRSGSPWGRPGGLVLRRSEMSAGPASAARCGPPADHRAPRRSSRRTRKRTSPVAGLEPSSRRP